MKESDLFQPVKDLLVSMGFSNIYGEVCEVDIYGYSDAGHTVSVELKKSLNVKVISQAVDNLAVSNYNYVAVPYVKGLSYSWNVLRKLGIGLIVIRGGKAYVSIKAKDAEPKRNLKKHIKPHHDRTVGGKKSGENPTAYSETMDRVIQFLKDNPLSHVDDIFECVPTRYGGKNPKRSLANTLNAKWNKDKIGYKVINRSRFYFYKEEGK